MNWVKEKLWTKKKSSYTSIMSVKLSDKPSESTEERVWGVSVHYKGKERLYTQQPRHSAVVIWQK